jgi:hypothetical protein
VIEQCLLFRFRLRQRAGLLGCLLGFGKGELLHDVARFRQQFVRSGRHPVLPTEPTNTIVRNKTDELTSMIFERFATVQ